MSPRPYWKGYLKLSLVSCPISLHAACSSSERVSFRQINRKTGNRLQNVHGPDVRVSNVVPHGPEGGAGGVEFVLTMDAPTDVAVTITVLDPWDAVKGWTGPE